MSTTLSIAEPQSLSAILDVPSIQLDERRSTRRAPRRITAYITAMGCMEGVCCTTENLSPEGLYAVAPPGASLQVGQRCEVVLRDEPGASLWPSYSDTGCYATIIHTQTSSREGMKNGSPSVGLGLRFDQPFYW